MTRPKNYMIDYELLTKRVYKAFELFCKYKGLDHQDYFFEHGFIDDHHVFFIKNNIGGQGFHTQVKHPTEDKDLEAVLYFTFKHWYAVMFEGSVPALDRMLRIKYEGRYAR